jgi:hypothetical protein
MMKKKGGWEPKLPFSVKLVDYSTSLLLPDEEENEQNNYTDTDSAKQPNQ